MKISHLCFFLLGFCSASHALLFSARAVEAALASADLIADIEVVSRQSVPDAQVEMRHLALSRVLHVVASHGSHLPTEGETLVVETAGGERQGTGVFYGGLPRLYQGARYRAYLKQGQGGGFRVVGMEAGLRRLDALRMSTRNRTDGSNGEGDGEYLYWNDSYLPIPYYLSLPSFRNVPFFSDAIDASFRTWRDVADIKIEFVAQGCTDSVRNENDGLNQIILMTETWPYDVSAIAITRNFYIANDGPRSGMILDTDILLNGVNQEFTTTGEPGKYDVQDILTHEIGHLLGLGHETAPEDLDAAMYARAEAGETKKRRLGPSDLIALRSAYAGVGVKTPSPATSALCLIPDQPTSCGAVHADRPPVAGLGFFLLALLLTPLLAGRLFQFLRFRFR